MRRHLEAEQQHGGGVMVDYVEFPTDLITKVVLPKKDDGEPPFHYGGNVPGPCGAYLLHLVLYERLPDFVVLANTGLWFLRPGFFADGSLGVIYHYAPRIRPRTDNEGLRPYDVFEIADYLWYMPASWTLTVFTPELDVDAGVLNVWRNADPTTFNPCVMTPDASIIIPPEGGSATIEVLAPLPGEWPPIFMVNNGSIGGSCDAVFAGVLIQAHCKDETTAANPPQPNGFPTDKASFMIQNAGSGIPAPPSWFLTNTNPAG